MESGFRAVNVTAREVANHALLEEAFNTWVDLEQPADILHIHYFQDLDARSHGYQVIYRLGVNELHIEKASRELPTFVV